MFNEQRARPIYGFNPPRLCEFSSKIRHSVVVLFNLYSFIAIYTLSQKTSRTFSIATWRRRI